MHGFDSLKHLNVFNQLRVPNLASILIFNLGLHQTFKVKEQALAIEVHVDIA